jgi:cytochrome c-type biogenesis protein CcmH
MTVFVGIALLMVALAVGLVLRPLLARGTADRVLAPGEANLEVLRDQSLELDNDLRTGVLSAEQHRRAKAELEGRVLEEAQSADQQQPRTGRSVATAAGIGLALPALAAALYFHLGTPDGLDAQPHAADAASSITLNEFEQMTGKLAARLEKNPDDAEGWGMLGRAYRALDRLDESVAAWARAAELKPNDASVLADYAEILAISREGRLAGEPTQLLTRALKADPDNPKARALAGGAAFERGDYNRAITHWEYLLARAGDDANLVQALNTGIAEARSRLTGKTSPAVEISGTVALSPEVADRAKPDDSVFVFVRAAKGPRMPLAITRVQVKNLPYDFRLDDSMAMVPEMKLSNFSEVVVAARVSRSGSAEPVRGDLEGASTVVKPGAAGIRVLIDRAVQ